ncbi:MAG: C40 family peptidase [Saprospiraceae bacterium]
MRKTFLFILLTSFIACQNNSIDVTPVQTTIDNIKQKYAPDKRVARFQVEAVPVGEKIVLRGETNLPDAKEEFLSQIDSEQFQIIDSIQMLPAAALAGNTYGVVNLSACNIRSKPKHSAELGTQSTLGTPLRVLKKDESGWYLIQTPDDYFGWLDPGGFELMNEAKYQNWLASERVIYTKNFGFAYVAADENSAHVSDLLEGNILQKIGEEATFTQVRFPDGREAFIPTNSAESYSNWLISRQPTAENILAKANEFMGRPYLWGGTSGKGVDCSGFTKTVFYLNGVMLPRDASQQVHTGVEVPTDTTWASLQAGDLLFFGRKATENKKERVTHVAIYSGDGKIIHSSGIVTVESLRRGDPTFTEYRFNTFLRAKRPLASLGKNGIEILATSPYYKTEI